MKKNIIIFLLFIQSSLFAITIDNQQLMKEANEHYKKQEYQQAVGIYEMIDSLGYSAPELYYNLGNAYYKLNKFPNAILNYERAKRLDPQNIDIQNNLDLANTRVVDKIDALPDFFLKSWINSLQQICSADMWAVMSIISFLFFLVLMSLFLYSNRMLVKQLSFWFGVVVFLFTLSTFYLARRQVNRLTYQNQAIIFSPSVTVKSSPDKSGTDLFLLHEGVKVNIENTETDWVEIKISDGRKGWVELSVLEKI